MLALSALLLPLMIGAVACSSSQMPSSTCVGGAGQGPTKGGTEPSNQWWVPTSSDKGVQGTWTCNSDGTSTFTPGASSSSGSGSGTK